MTMRDERTLRRLWQRLVHTEKDRDIYQDAFLWMEKHPCESSQYEARFRNRFQWLRVGMWQKEKGSVRLNADCPAGSDDEDITPLSMETKEEFVNNLRNAIHKETHQSGRKKKPRV